MRTSDITRSHRSPAWLAVTLLAWIVLGACGEDRSLSTRPAATAPAPAAVVTTVAPTVPATAPDRDTTSATATGSPATASATLPAATPPAPTSTPPGPGLVTAGRDATITTAPAINPVTPVAGLAVSPVVLGPAEAILKATGFSAEAARAYLDELTGQVGVRVAGTEGEIKAANWIEQKFKSFGYSATSQQTFPVQMPGAGIGAATATPGLYTSRNVVAIRPATGPQARVLIFGGHFDTVPGTVGASDNGSGTVTTLEVARTLKDKLTQYELRFITFGAEETGLWGSRFYTSGLSQDEKNRIIAFINLDALGVGDRFVASGTPELVNLTVDVAAQNGIRLEPLDLSRTGASSDHVSFIRQGLKGVMLIRWLDPQLHRPGDIPERVQPQALLLGGGMAILLAQKLATLPGSKAP